MATGDIKLAYASSAALTITLASLATDTNLLAGRESTAVDNTSNLYIDYLLAGKVTTGTSPTTLKEIRVYVGALIDDSTWPDVLDGTDSNETITSSDIRDAGLRLAAVMSTKGGPGTSTQAKKDFQKAGCPVLPARVRSEERVVRQRELKGTRAIVIGLRLV